MIGSPKAHNIWNLFIYIQSLELLSIPPHGLYPWEMGPTGHSTEVREFTVIGVPYVST